MDTEEELKLEKASFQKQMAAETDNRLHAFWESYKGGIKGKIGGFVLGALVGATLGIPAATLLSTAGVSISFGSIVLGFTCAGMLYGAHEFDQVGKISGGVAAGLQTTEGRLKKYLGKELGEIKDDIEKIKSKVGVTETSAPTQDEQETFRSKHLLERHKGKSFYPKLAIIGLVVGLAVGGLLASTHFAYEALSVMGMEVAKMSSGTITAVTMSAMGVLGASFGINRDYFRAVFDKTDSWFKKISKPSKSQEAVVEQDLEVATPLMENNKTQTRNSGGTDVTTAVLYSDNGPEKSGTYFRDQVTASRTAMLLGFDPSGSRPH